MEAQIKSVEIISNQRKIRLIILESNPTLPVLLFIPGMGCYSDTYLPFLRQINELGFTIVSVDLDGHGFSEGKRGCFRFEEIMTTIRNSISFIKSKYTTPIGLMGTSLGGTYALYASLKDKSIHSLLCHCAMDIASDLAVPSRYPKLVMLLKRIGFVARIFPNIPVPLKIIVDWEKVVDGNKSLLEKLMADKKMVWAYSIGSWYSLLRYKDNLSGNSINIPYKIVVGEHDLLFPPEHCKGLVSKIGGNENNLEIIKNGGHFLPFNKQNELAGIVSNWFHSTLK